MSKQSDTWALQTDAPIKKQFSGFVFFVRFLGSFKPLHFEPQQLQKTIQHAMLSTRRSSCLDAVFESGVGNDCIRNFRNFQTFTCNFIVFVVPQVGPQKGVYA